MEDNNFMPNNSELEINSNDSGDIYESTDITTAAAISL
jgi:hypothetical protein